MSDVLKVSQAVARGLSVVCATCAKYWQGRERGLPDPQCTATEGCGGPLSGDDFHEYAGPLTDFARWCFVCGHTATHGVRVGARSRVIGMCSEHLVLLDQLEPVELPEMRPCGREAYVIRNGDLIPPSRLFPRKKSLLQAILEVEKYYAEKE